MPKIDDKNDKSSSSTVDKRQISSRYAIIDKHMNEDLSMIEAKGLANKP